jgi:hypothetical protein
MACQGRERLSGRRPELDNVVPDTGELDYPNEAREIQHRIAAARAV